ncbi:MAG: hypothetical protein H0X45_04870 [Planctomycetes bacterium]|nr:hypothetical protein [Planctomycetota bacterium]
MSAMTPEGLRLTGSAGITYAASAILPGDDGLEARHVSMWIRADTWAGQVPIFDARTPAASLGAPLGALNAAPAVADARVTGSSESQNLWSLTYDAVRQHLVLALANSAIEHPGDYGLPISEDVVGGGSTTDERTLGGGTLLAPKRPWNRVEHRYRIGLQADRWYLIQVAFSTDRIGGQAIIVDGFVGRDIVQNPRSSAGDIRVTDMEDGDHATLPALLLATDLAVGTPVQTHTPFAIPVRRVLPEISTLSPTRHFLPASGMVRIGNEYISYSGLNASSLTGCLRGRRQNTILVAGDPATLPVMPAHLAGDLIVPGGYRLSMRAQTIRQGGCTLAFPVHHGVAPDYEVRARLANDVLATSTVIPIDNIMGVFPPRGYVMIDAEIMFYDNAGVSPTTQLIGVVRGQPPSTGAAPWPAAPHVAFANKQVQLISLAVNGPNPDNDDLYPKDVNAERIIQLYDTASAAAPELGRIEWLRYTGFALDPLSRNYYFIDLGAFAWDAATEGSRRRGIQRTAFAGDSSTGLGNTTPWPANSRVLPVQANEPGDASGFVCETGDVVTFARRDGSGTPIQACVRYRPVDDFASGSDWKNHWFALSEALPQPIILTETDMLCWPCWNGADLSPMANLGDPIANVRGLMPKAAAWGAGAPVTFAAYSPPATGAFSGFVDLPTSGQLPGNSGTSNISRDVVLTWNLDPSVIVASITATQALPIGVTATSDVFTADTGLVCIGGEVFAYRRPIGGAASSADLIGRALLGSGKHAHLLNEQILVLPLGPVTTLEQALNLADAKKVDAKEDAIFQAPAILLTKADPLVDAEGDSMASSDEIVVFPRPSPGASFGATAPWLRGLYGTSATTWPADDTIAIGWYPRYPSALPSTAPLDEHYRCRSYPWATFAQRFYDARTDLGELSIHVVDDGDAMFLIEAKASGSAMAAWSGAPKILLEGPNNNITDLMTALGSNTDGVEVRIYWRNSNDVTNNLIDIADKANRSPMLGPASLRTRAASTIIATEESR